LNPTKEEASMTEVIIIGIDIAKNVFHLHGAAVDGTAVFRRKLSRTKFLEFVAKQPTCLVAMEACAGAHHWGREISRFGHEVRLIPPQYVKPFVKRQKNDAADAEAIAEAASRASMRFVAIKSAEQQGQAMILKTRDLLQAQRTQTVNALRGHLAEHGLVAPQGLCHVCKLETALDDKNLGIPPVAIDLCRVLFEHIRMLSVRINELTAQIKRTARSHDITRRLMTIPGIGPIGALALSTLAPSKESFKKGRDFSAWAGLTPKQHSTGGKTRLGKTSKMGQRDIRRLLIIGAMSVIKATAHRRPPEGSWLARMLAKKPKMLVAVALANKMARIAWALITGGGVYKVPVVA